MTKEVSTSVSVIIPVYNGEQHIRRAIDSVLAQTHPAAEIIVVDDGSTDTTRQIVQSYGTPVQTIYQENAGPGAARNAGIQAAKGEWIAFLDSDDEWLPEKLQIQVNLLQRHPDLVWATSNFLRCLCDQDYQGPDLDPAKAERLMNGKEYFENYFTSYPLGCGGCTDTMIIHHSVFDAVGLFETVHFHAEDIDLWCRIAFRWPRFAYCSEPLAIYHMDSSSSLMQEKVDSRIFHEYMERNLKLANQSDSMDIFKPYVSYILQQWMRAMLFENNAEGIRRLLKPYGEFIPTGFRAMMRFLTTFPRCSACLCKTASRFVRFFHLRKRITRPPAAG
jgi:glycosyltransferase involved in cell wall biosynthesis